MKNCLTSQPSENTNQNFIEIPSHPSQNDYQPQNKTKKSTKQKPNVG
jgi:hypothetical protein